VGFRPQIAFYSYARRVMQGKIPPIRKHGLNTNIKLNINPRPLSCRARSEANIIVHPKSYARSRVCELHAKVQQPLLTPRWHCSTTCMITAQHRFKSRLGPIVRRFVSSATPSNKSPPFQSNQCWTHSESVNLFRLGRDADGTENCLQVMK
jgi:hypothetical protein